jgi:hypothetical protein
MAAADIHTFVGTGGFDGSQKYIAILKQRSNYYCGQTLLLLWTLSMFNEDDITISEAIMLSYNRQEARKHVRLSVCGCGEALK